MLTAAKIWKKSKQSDYSRCHHQTGNISGKLHGSITFSSCFSVLSGGSLLLNRTKAIKVSFVLEGVLLLHGRIIAIYILLLRVVMLTNEKPALLLFWIKLSGVFGHIPIHPFIAPNIWHGSPRGTTSSSLGCPGSTLIYTDWLVRSTINN